jgi:hypothetical protein
LSVFVVAGALPVFAHVHRFVEEAVYDALFAASAPGYVTDQPVNATKIGGTSQTGRDLGASVLLSSGTGTGQLDFTSGVVKGNVTQWSGTNVASPDTAGYPKVTVKSGTGTGELDLSSGGVAIRGNIMKAAAFQQVHVPDDRLHGSCASHREDRHRDDQQGRRIVRLAQLWR